MKFVFWSLSVLSGLVTLFLVIVMTMKSINYSIDISGHLKRAADANTIQLAEQELDVAISNIEANGMTSGSTNLIFHQPANDLGFWYTNIKASRHELSTVTDKTSQLEKTNLLMKLRETLLDHGQHGNSVTDPDSISMWPHPWGYPVWLMLSIAITGLFGFGGYTAEN